ncbi:glycine cleavage system aminomethyltransferase GcvT [Planktothrix paucivesiculata]|uniref:Aminomethyltransferase n=1 Tax=Planktothrix paucivesiculata PCC 9631 TaxID=671071 RepID=A0A7Z9BY09_9CYAN|nr:glycine cleavage system aminomethyltransferase GcvT [Planktothrix paucivesiculata]VXD21356.1 Aminomethyltransferase [Planktothrix paucivesiculata PCC 9631]
MTTTLSHTPLYNVSVELNGRMVPFAGWEMAVQFSGINPEHQAVRQAVGMFDISHMGKFILRGENLINALQSLVPSDLSRLQPGEAQYSALLNAQGGILDDIIFYDQGVDPVTNLPQGVMIVNAATKSRDKAWISAHIEDQGIILEDLSRDKVLLAVQGPQAEATLQPFVSDNLSEVKFFGHITTTVLGKPAFIARTGYTGEDGFEVMVAPSVGVELWKSLATAGVIPCGLGARDTLRLEAAMALYGQDIGLTTTPLEAGLNWIIHWDTKGKFIGRQALEQQKAAGVTQKLVGLEMQGRHIARHGYPVLFNGETVGEITSGTLSPTLGKAISMAYVPTTLSKIGQSLDIEIRGKTYPATVVKRPFYRSPNRPKNPKT